ncbi:MAG: orotidine-5'-phosphate decarboxylase [Deltaproteobacteria bacterium]|nr:orotidine-5'-phosphate decarboxylase [Deltaproteobacteria bacterium]
MRAHERIVFPLDVETLDEARVWLARLAGEVGVMKVGLELFTSEGPSAVRAVVDAGFDCFLDLKLHDIPETVGRAVRRAVGLGARYLTLHAAGGPAMLARASEAARDGRTTLLAITVLTSLDDAALGAIGLRGTTAEAVARLGSLAVEHGCGGLVCSPLEVSDLRGRLGTDVVLATPGVRPRGAAVGDQRRVASAEDAMAAGADLVVVGRPIRDAADPVAAARALAAEIAAGLARRGATAPGMPSLR